MHLFFLFFLFFFLMTINRYGLVHVPLLAMLLVHENRCYYQEFSHTNKGCRSLSVYHFFHVVQPQKKREINNGHNIFPSLEYIHLVILPFLSRFTSKSKAIQLQVDGTGHGHKWGAWSLLGKWRTLQNKLRLPFGVVYVKMDPIYDFWLISSCPCFIFGIKSQINGICYGGCPDSIRCLLLAMMISMSSCDKACPTLSCSYLSSCPHFPLIPSFPNSVCNMMYHHFQITWSWNPRHFWTRVLQVEIIPNIPHN